METVDCRQETGALERATWLERVAAEDDGGSMDAYVGLKSAAHTLREQHAQITALSADAARLEWMLSNPLMRVQGDNSAGWSIMEGSVDPTFLVKHASSARAAIDLAIYFRGQPSTD